MKIFWIKLVNLMLVLAALAGYQGTLSMRADQEELARLDAQLAQTVAQLEANQETDADSAKEETAGQYADGVYTGSAQGFGGLVTVEVTVENGAIADIAVTSAAGEDGAYLSMASALLYDIVDTQGTEVNTVSGATFSSRGLIDAVEAALEQAGVE